MSKNVIKAEIPVYLNGSCFNSKAKCICYKMRKLCFMLLKAPLQKVKFNAFNDLIVNSLSE